MLTATAPHRPPADQQAEDAQYYRRVLHELIDLDVDLARVVRKQATAEDGVAGPAAAAAFDRLSRAVRRTVALARRLAGPELDDEIGNRPVAEVVTEICRDLGLGTMLGNHPWKRRLPADVAAMAARAARPPGSPPDAEPSPAPEMGAGSGPGPGRSPTAGRPRSS